ncbi:hypothetical protein [Novosphingobium rosa]|uniref:hypothetical protein n=1 Tax=Novosphingobium rosa TaxID=76978 RepID=UPI000834CA24|nr:hypothetical protein [Novosphingobium rosa]
MMFRAMMALAAALQAPAAPPHAAPLHADWRVLEETRPQPWQSADGVNHLAPLFTPDALALDGKEVELTGFASSEEDGPISSFTLYANHEDCELHLPTGPQVYAVVDLARPAKLPHGAITVHGRLVLVHERTGGVFYRIADGAFSVTPA